MNITDKITLTNEDNMELMSRYPDNYFDLAIVDPPYFNGPDKLGYFGANYSKTKVKRQNYKSIGEWGVPDELYFNELSRVSKHQIIWGFNYYNIKNLGSGRIIWDKKNDASTFSDCEIAYCSSKEHVKVFRFMWNGMLQEDMQNKETRIHPTQKPVALYKWIFEKYGKPNFKYLDTHFGSGSIGIAFDEMLNVWDLAGHDISNAELIACELDKDYFEATIKRLNNKFGNEFTFDDAPANQTNIFDV